MGQSSSKHSSIVSGKSNSPRNMKNRVLCESAVNGDRDVTADLPGECLACIFQFLDSQSRKNASMVCRRWFRIEGEVHNRLSLNAQADLCSFLPSLFTRFDSVTKLALRCERKSTSVGDKALMIVSENCPNLLRLKLRGCREITDSGMAAFATRCRSLKKLSCGSCSFGFRGMNAILDNCSHLEELSVKKLRGLMDDRVAEPLGPGKASSSLKRICLKQLYNGQYFAPLITSSENLKRLKLFRCFGDWDPLFLDAAGRNRTTIVEIHLERIQASDAALEAISKCSGLEIFHLIKVLDCTNCGLAAIAAGCKRIRKLHLDGWKRHRISDEGLLAISKNCHFLQELVLVGLNPTIACFDTIVSTCHNLERLAICSSYTMNDEAICCVAAKCLSLKKLCIKSCPISNLAVEALSHGCPNLVKLKVRKCDDVTLESANRLREIRRSLSVIFDTGEPEHQDANATGIVQETETGFSSLLSNQIASISSPADIAACFRTRYFAAKSWISCYTRRWPSCKTSS